MGLIEVSKPSDGIVIKGIEEGEIYLILEESEMQTRRLEIRVWQRRGREKGGRRRTEEGKSSCIGKGGGKIQDLMAIKPT